MNERDKFEAWFENVFGKKPEGDIVRLAEELDSVKRNIEWKIASLRKWDMQHQAALWAWSERNNRKE